MKGRTLKIIAAVSAAAVFLTVAVFSLFSLSYNAREEYDAVIKHCSEIFGVEYALIYAVIRTESGFDTQAKSAAGAAGLMQIMPETGKWIAEKLLKQDYSEEKLFDPAYNIELGVWYLAYLVYKFGDTDTALTAYNAGEGNVKKWREEGIEIPFPETREYVKKVNRHYKYYKKFL